MVEKLTSNPDYQPADPNLKSKIVTPPRPTYPTVKKHASKKAKPEESRNKADSTAA